MKRIFPRRRWLRLGLIPACLLVPLVVLAKSTLEARYPYDPACPWGRLSNGKGMLHRCLSEQEASQIAGAEPLNRLKEPSLRKEHSAPHEAPSAEAKDKEDAVAKPDAALRTEVQVSVGPIEASEGEITMGRLGLPVDRYKKCVVDNGGLSAQAGTVTVKFLVRAEAERAEGASVESAVGVSAKAAQCVADVVDRRQVGSPSADMTGAKLQIRFTK
jgi:hypothetical protein